LDRSRAALVSGVVAGAAGLFILDLIVPLGVAVWLPYVGVVLISLWFPFRWQTYGTAALCTLLMGVGLSLSPRGEAAFWMSAVNRLMGIGAVWTVAVVGLAARRTYELREAYQSLQREIAERERLQSQLLRTQRLESIGVLASGIAHDFNNLLTPILMSVKLLKEERPEDERLHLLETLQASGERAAEMVQQLLSFAGGLDGGRIPMRLKGIVKEVTSILDHTFPKSLRIEAVVDPGLALVLGNPTQVSQVLMNLCVNARDAMPSGGRITISAANVIFDPGSAPMHPDARPGSYVVLRVSDTGCGIPPSIVDQVFDPFFTTKEPGRGTGLGLATALGIVKSHGGFIDVASELNKGSQFAIYLPALASAPGEECEPDEVDVPRGNGELVLLVDDEPSVLETARLTLEAGGYQVTAASDGAEAVTIFRQQGNAIRAVILDVMMPEMDGLATLEALQRMDSRVRVLAASGVRPRGRLAEMIAGGLIGFLQKPYSARLLLGALAAVLHPNQSKEQMHVDTTGR